MARLDVSLLGGFQARLESGSPLALPTKKAQALLGYLAIPLGQAHARDKLAALLWGGIREESARASLRQALFAIRKALGETKPLALLLEGETLALNRSVVDVDVATFEGLMAEGTPDALTKAAVLYQGDPLAGFVWGPSPRPRRSIRRFCGSARPRGRQHPRALRRAQANPPRTAWSPPWRLRSSAAPPKWSG